MGTAPTLKIRAKNNLYILWQIPYFLLYFLKSSLITEDNDCLYRDRKSRISFNDSLTFGWLRGLSISQTKALIYSVRQLYLSNDLRNFLFIFSSINERTGKHIWFVIIFFMSWLEMKYWKFLVRKDSKFKMKFLRECVQIYWSLIKFISENTWLHYTGGSAIFSVFLSSCLFILYQWKYSHQGLPI